MGPLSEALAWLTNSSNWQGEFGITRRLFEHVSMSAACLGLAGTLALPVGFFIGHTRRMEFVAVSIGNLGRAIPSFGILAFVFPFTLKYLPGIGYWPTFIALFLLAIPPMLTNTYVGVQSVDSGVLEAARGMGMRTRDLVRTVEIPLAAPLIMAGIRTAAVQVVATATLGAVVAWGGLGRYIIDGFGSIDRGMLPGGAILVAALALVTELALELFQKMITPRLTSKSSNATAQAL